MAKKYRIVQKIYKEGTKYQESMFYPQVMDSRTLNAEIELWEFYDDPSYKDEKVWYHGKDMALEFIQERKAEDITVKTIIQLVD